MSFSIRLQADYFDPDDYEFSDEQQEYISAIRQVTKHIMD